MSAPVEVDPQELELFRDTVRRFARDEIEPHYEQWERDEIFPRELWTKLGEQGFLGTDLPEEYGGVGAPFHFSNAVIEELSRLGYNAIAVSITVHSSIVAHYLVNHGTEAQKEAYLPGMVSGTCIGAIGMTEPGAGSDLQGIKTSARREGDGWVLNGQKTFITNGQHADLVVTAARTNPEASGAKGTTLFLVEADKPGYEPGRNLEKIGLHSSDTSEIYFEDVWMTDEDVLGEVDRGFVILMEELARERLALGACAVAAAEGAIDWTVDYVHERSAFGRSIAGFQNTRFRLAELATDTRAQRAFLNECTDLHARGALDAETAAMLKLSTTELQDRVMDGCLQLFGGYGYMREYPIARAYVDSRVQRIYGGTSEIMKEIVARKLLGRV